MDELAENAVSPAIVYFLTSDMSLMSCCFARIHTPPAAPAPARRRRDPAEEGVKDKLILEMRAEITRLRANVMTAHEKIRTLEQLHAHDEVRIQQLMEELGVKEGPEAVARIMASPVILASAAAAASVETLPTAVEDAVNLETMMEPANDDGENDDNENRKQKAVESPEEEPAPKKGRVNEELDTVEV